MGGIWSPRIQIISELGELVGYKSGLALTREELQEHASDRGDILFQGDDDDTIRIRSEEVEEIYVQLLHSVGYVRTPSPVPSFVQAVHEYKNTSLFPIYEELLGEFLKVLESATGNPQPGTKIDPRPYVEASKAKHGDVGELIAMQIVLGIAEDMEKSPWSRIRRVAWCDTTELQELFKSENLQTMYGKFFDQRFIDYLSANHDSIGDINWRKFEGLTAEYFHRLGFEVEIGAGRNDENVDIRVWPKGIGKNSAPPAILVQCKRQEEKVGKVVVKALYADVMFEKAGSGLVVTSSALSPGAKKVCRARGYPIDEANREALRKWIESMRSPFAGVVFGV